MNVGIKGRRPIVDADRNTEYGGADPVELQSMFAAIRDMLQVVWRPLQSGKATLYMLTAQTMPLTTSFHAAAGSVAAGSSATEQCRVSSRVTGIELWNFDATGTLRVRMQSASGGSMGSFVSIPPNTYYNTDISMGPDTELELRNDGTGAIAYQVKFNGF